LQTIYFNCYARLVGNDALANLLSNFLLYFQFSSEIPGTGEN